MDLFRKIFEAKKEKNDGKFTLSHKKLLRRGHKLCEETGEVSEAIFGVTDDDNHKEKTYDDLKEELVDVIITATEMLFSDFEHTEENLTYDEILNDRLQIFDKKLTKWLSDKKKGK